MQNKSNKRMPWFFFAAAFQSLLALISLLRVPSEGLSLARLGLLGALVFFLVSGIALGIFARRDSSRFDKLVSIPIILSSALLALTFGLILFLLRYLDPERLLPYYERLGPLMWLVFVLTLEAVIFLLYLKNGFHFNALTERKQVYVYALLAFLLLFSIFLFVAITKIGITPDTSYWAEPGVAIQGWQFILALLLGFATLLLSVHFSSHVSRFSFLIPFVLYLTAVVLWLSVPLETLANSFFAPISPPIHQPLPYSDAGFYDFNSQSLLIGTGYFGTIPSRPLYVTFLAFLHLLFDQNYPAILAAQTMVLAFFPVILYFLAKKIHSPAAGVTVALFAIFRETTNLWIASNTRVVNSKMMMTDFPTALGIALMSLLTFWWLQRRDLRATIVAGGAFGVLLLFRTQSLLTLPLLLLLVLLIYQFKWAECFKVSIIFAVSMVLTVLPWLTHNYTVVGKFAFDDSIQMGNLYQQYSFNGLGAGSFDPQKDSVAGQVIRFTLENPGYVATFIAAHFLNTEIGSLLSLPLIKPFNGFQEPINLYWVAWDGSLEWYNLVLVLFYLGVVAFGLGAAWRRVGWLGVVPLAFHLGYVLSNSIVRFSGWRFNLPADWVAYFYFGLGIIELFGLLFLLFNVDSKRVFPSLEISHPKKVLFSDFRIPQIAMIFLFVLVGFLPWLAKGFAEPRYTSTQEELAAKLETRGYDHGDIQAFLAQPDTVLLEGRLLYPRMYWKGEGLASTNPWPAYAERDFPRIGFILINDNHRNFIFPTNELLDFPQGADATILACYLGDNLYQARVIDFGGAAYQSSSLTDPCVGY